jgi:hypothetical protein
MVLLALVAHGSVLFGGWLALDAKTFLYVKARQAVLRARANKAESITQNDAEAAGAAFSNYVQRLNVYNDDYPEDRLQAGPFDAVTARVLAEHFGHEVINTGGAPGETSPRNGQDEPVEENSMPVSAIDNEPQGDTDAENEYLRRILEQRRREDESEVTGD